MMMMLWIDYYGTIVWAEWKLQMLAAGPEQAHYSVRANLSWTANAKLWKRILKSIYIHGIAEEFKNELLSIADEFLSNCVSCC